MVGKEDFKKKAKEMAEKARAKAQGEKAKQTKQPEESEAEQAKSRPTGISEELKQEYREGPQER